MWVLDDGRHAVGATFWGFMSMPYDDPRVIYLSSEQSCNNMRLALQGLGYHMLARRCVARRVTSGVGATVEAEC